MVGCVVGVWLGRDGLHGNQCGTEGLLLGLNLRLHAMTTTP